MTKKVSNRGRKKEEASRLLSELAPRYDRRFLETDPVCYVHRYEAPKDREVVALLSALLAFGNVKAIHGSLAKVFELVGPSPSGFVEGFDAELWASRFAALGHRWVRGADLLRLFVLLKNLIARHGSIKSAFLAHYQPEDSHVGPLLARFSRSIFANLERSGLSRGFRYFFPSPTDGSPCKRLTLFLRWMVRPADGIDLGLWTEIPASKLIIPLDTHVYRFARRFRLSPYKNPRWEVAVHVTEFLKELDPLDPVRFDFPICHHGMEVGW